MSEVLQLLSRIAQATSVNAVWDGCAVFFRDHGFSRANYGYTRYRTERNIGDPDDALYLSTSAPEYAKLYFRDGFYAKTPMYRWVSQNNGVCTWRWVSDAYAAGTLTPSEAEAVRMNIAMNVVAGVSISFPETSSRSKGALGLAADQGLTHDDVDQIWATHGQAILAVANMMHLKITQLPLNGDRRSLTDRQREALEWVADGKTTQDIATIMGVTAATIEKHLRLARDALDVETTAQAVAKAAMLNMIFQNATGGGADPV